MSHKINTVGKCQVQIQRGFRLYENCRSIYVFRKLQQSHWLHQSVIQNPKYLWGCSGLIKGGISKSGTENISPRCLCGSEVAFMYRAISIKRKANKSPFWWGTCSTWSVLFDLYITHTPITRGFYGYVLVLAENIWIALKLLQHLNWQTEKRRDVTGWLFPTLYSIFPPSAMAKECVTTCSM